MKVTQKWQDVTLMNSQCSEATNEGQISIYKAVIKNLKDKSCLIHNQLYSYYYKQKIMCASCFAINVSKQDNQLTEHQIQKYKFIYNLETILNNPLILVIERQELLKYPVELIQLMITSYKQVYEKKSDFKLKKSLISSFISRLKSKVQSLCEEILCAFNQMEENWSKQSILKEQLINLSSMYEGQLVQMLGQNFIQYKKDELQNILKQYSSINESPCAKITQNMSEMMSCLIQDPVVDIAALQKIYRTVTDDMLWKPNKLFVSRTIYFQQKFQRAQVIINNDQIQLQKQYILKMQENKLVLLMEQQEIGRLHLHIDSLYSLPNYKLLGVNYNKLFVINYFDQLTIQEEYSITGCTDVLTFPNHIIAISNQQLTKIDLTTQKYHKLGNNYTDLRYCKSKPSLFACQNKHGITTYWDVWDDKPQVLWF